MTVSGSSNRMALTSDRTRPRPSEIFCFSSAVRPTRLPVGQPLQADALDHFVDARLDLRPCTPRLRSGKARFSRTVIES